MAERTCSNCVDIETLYNEGEDRRGEIFCLTKNQYTRIAISCTRHTAPSLEIS